MLHWNGVSLKLSINLLSNYFNILDKKISNFNLAISLWLIDSINPLFIPDCYNYHFEVKK